MKISKETRKLVHKLVDMALKSCSTEQKLFLEISPHVSSVSYSYFARWQPGASPEMDGWVYLDHKGSPVELTLLMKRLKHAMETKEE